MGEMCILIDIIYLLIEFIIHPHNPIRMAHKNNTYIYPHTKHNNNINTVNIRLFVGDVQKIFKARNRIIH